MIILFVVDKSNANILAQVPTFDTLQEALTFCEGCEEVRKEIRSTTKKYRVYKVTIEEI